jgi:hypothetical protein
MTKAGNRLIMGRKLRRRLRGRAGGWSLGTTDSGTGIENLKTSVYEGVTA